MSEDVGVKSEEDLGVGTVAAAGGLEPGLGTWTAVAQEKRTVGEVDADEGNHEQREEKRGRTGLRHFVSAGAGLLGGS